MTRAPSGYVHVPHTADLRIEAWAPTREECVAETVRGLVDSFTEVAAKTPTTLVECTVRARDGDELLVVVLEEVVYQLDTQGRVPLRAQVRAAPSGEWHLQFAMADVDTLVPVGAVPKAVSLHGLRLDPSTDGWRCGVTIDV